VPANVPAEATRGTIVAIGGGEDKLKEKHVLQKIVQLAGGSRARIGLIPTASQIPQNLAAIYTKVFRELGAAETIVFNMKTRDDASSEDALEALDRATLAFFTGGDQLRLVSMLGGTPFVTSLRRRNASGMPIAGTSAGAGAVCQHMIARGRSGQMVNQRMVSLAPGLGLTNRIVVDQHFSQRHRVGRLFTAVALNPFLVGVGIDEDTAALLDGAQAPSPSSTAVASATPTSPRSRTARRPPPSASACTCSRRAAATTSSIAPSPGR
jgi:cyanophycinase